MAKACCGVDSGANKDSFFATTKWKVGVLIAGVILCVISYFWENILGAAYGVGKYFNPAWAVVFVCGWPLAFGGFKNLFKYGKVRTSLLITVAMIACIALEILCWCGITSDGMGHHSHNNLFSAGEVALIMWLGELLEDVTLKRSRKNLESLVKLTPVFARIKMGDQYIEMETQYVAVGDVVLVKPNETITVDGVVLSGVTSVSQSAITGESVPVDKKEGDVVFAGTQNGAGAIEISVTRAAEDTTLSKMIKLVKDAESKKADVERTADKWAKFIVPGAIILSIVVFAVVLFVLKEEWQTALTRAITILVVFCPCSLALATPTAIVAGMGNASSRGVLVKSGSALERIAKAEVVVFDKTGTLTQNKLCVRDFVSEVPLQEFFLLVGSAEMQSEHPLAKAITDFCRKKVELKTPAQTTSIVGVGVKSVVEGKQVTVAKADYFENYPENTKQFLQKAYSQGFTVVSVSVDDKIVGALGLSDAVASGAKDTVAALRQQKIETVMLTGDNLYVASAVAKEVGILEFDSNLLPEHKVEKVKQIKKEGKTVCMVGDGVNDAPALVTADVGIAMGAVGSDVAMEVADVVLMNDNIKNVCGVVRLGKRVLKTITVNISMGMVVNLASVVLSIFGILTPVLGALVHNLSSFLVVGNSALLIGVKKPFKGCDK